MRLIDADHFLTTLNKVVSEHESLVWQKIAETMTFMVESECEFFEVTIPEQEEPKRCDSCKHEKTQWFNKCADCSDYELWESKE